MNKEIHYRKPPIVEVVCEFQFLPSEPWDFTIPGDIYYRLKGSFSKRKMVKAIQSVVATSEQNNPTPQFELTDRIQFLRDDEKALVQVGADLLSINHLEPYPSWDEFQPLISLAFDAYRQAAKPVGIRRIGLRFINKIVFPSWKIELSKYMNFYPSTIGLGDPIESFMAGAVRSYEKGRDNLRVQLTSAEPEAPGHAAMIFDLDYFMAQMGLIDLDTAMDWVEVAHTNVISTFEACITQASRDMFEPEE